jgi:hypothetical protein
MHLPFSCLHHGHVARLGAGVLLMAVAALAGCGKSATISLQAFLDGTASDTEGDGAGDTWGDEFLTPDDARFAIGLQSASLKGSSVSHTIFEQDLTVDAPVIVRPATSADIPTNGEELEIDTYDTLELEVLFYEAAIVVPNGASSEIRRLRVYMTDYTETLQGTDTVPEQFDLMMSADPFDPADSNTGTDMRWIERADGTLCDEPIRSDCIDVYQASSSQFSDYSYPTVALPLPSDIEVTSDTDQQFIVKLNLGINNLFFFDDIEDNSVFDYLNPDDGSLEEACGDADCSTGAGEADFWIGPPSFDLDIETL